MSLPRFNQVLCGASFMTAALLAFISMAISETHDVTAGVLMAIAQFLLFCASILGIDYKIKDLLKRYEKDS